jgi:translocation and assembly module TamB
VEAAGFDLGALESWSTRPKIPIEIDRMGIEISQIQPFMVADFSLAAHATNEEFEDLDVSLKGSTGSEGVRLERASGSMEGLTFIDGVFGLPILVHPVGRPTLVSPIPDQPVEGELTADISETLADKLPRIPYIGILPGMSARLTAEGTSESPVAGIDVSLEHLYPFKELDPSLDEYPLENVRLVARISPDLVELRTLEASVKDARLTATGTITMTSIIRLTGEETFRWGELLEENAFSARLENFQAGSFAGILPPYLRPTGSLDGRLEASPNAGVNGRLSLNDFSLRPTLYSPTVDGIHLDLEIDNRRMTLDKAGATVGNSEVGLTGYLDFKEWDNPTFKFNMTGERTPLLRTPDLLLHGDIDLDLDGSDPSMPPRLGGNIQLRDSVMLMDIDPMAARTSGQELPKPPFFNLTAPPFADWLLDVDISGEDFLRFRSPYVKALVSIQLNLTGTAANPVWIGDLSSTEGTIEFPGLRMTVSRSEIFITRERQDTVQLDLNAIGQVASYVVSLRVDETIDDPHVEFASTPDLNNTQILHLLATGSPERSGLSSVGLYLGRGLFDPGATNSVWDRFSIEIGRDVSESSKDTLDLYYDISEKWRIHGQYDKYDAQNINLEWEVFSR